MIVATRNPLAREKISFSLNLAADTAKLVGDGRALGQLVHHLLS